jgi:hypothetical protein
MRKLWVRNRTQATVIALHVNDPVVQEAMVRLQRREAS